MARMKAVQIPKPGAELQVVEREIPKAGPGHVRIRVQTCGVCHSDVVAKDGLFPGTRDRRDPCRRESRSRIVRYGVRRVSVISDESKTESP